MQYLTKRGSVYWLKKRVPGDIRHLLPYSVVQESLRTSSDTEAKRRRDIRLTELNLQWDALRKANNLPTQYLSPQELHEAIRLRQEFNSIPIDSVKREDMLRHIQDRTEDISEDPFNPSDKGGEFYGIATGETVFLKDAADQFLANTRLKTNTKNLYRTVLGQVALSLPYVNEVTKDKARAFLQAFASTRTKKAVNNLLSAVKTLWKHLGQDVSVWEGHRIEAGKDIKKKGVYSSKELQKLLSKASPRLHDAILIAAYSGLRRQEICGLVYDSTLDQLVVTKEKAKNSEPRRVPCHSEIRESVKRFIQSQKDNPLNEKNLSNTFAELLVDAGVPKTISVDGEVYKRDFHALRHTFASKLVELGVDVSVVGRLLGHKGANEITLKYGGKADPESLRKYVDMLRYD
jgi:integrase